MVNDATTFAHSLAPNKAPHSSRPGMVVCLMGANLFLEVKR